MGYEIWIHGLQFPKLSFADTTPEFKNINLNPVDTNKFLYEILVEKNTKNLTIDELRSVIQEATLEVQTFVYVFSVAADVKIFDFTCKGYKHKDCLVSLNQLLAKNLGSIIQAEGIVTAGPQSIALVKEKMKEHPDLSTLWMFYDSATITEPIGRFISLYTLMLHYCSDGQKDSQPKVDEAILSIDPTVAQFKSPKFNRYETIFTRLRNELSHKRDGVDILETHNQVHRNIDRFEQIVKIHVLDKT